MTIKKKSSLKDNNPAIPVFGSGVITDSIGPTEQSKPSATGIFTMFWAWGFPCNRSCFLITTIFNIPKGDMNIYVSINKKGSRKKNEIGNAKLYIKKDIDTGTTITIPLQFRFKSEGQYEIICQFRDYAGRLKIPLIVKLKKWPKLTIKEKAFAKKNPKIIRSFRVNARCRNCDHTYIFEETGEVDSEPTGGVLRFPESGVLECGECGNEMNLRDIQGQMRESLKETIKMAMRDKK